MVKLLNADGTFSADAFAVSLDKLTREDTFEPIEVKANFENYDEETHQPTGAIVSVTYSIFVPDLRGCIRVKVAQTRMLISQEKLNNAQEEVYVKVPISETLIKPWKIDHGKFFVTITAPTISLA